MFGRGVFRVKVEVRKNDVIVTTQSQTARGTSYVVGAARVVPDGASKQDLKKAVLKGLSQALA